MTHIELNPELVAPPRKPPSEAELLRTRLDEIAASLTAEFAPDLVGRVLIAAGVDLMLEKEKMLATRWALSRAHDLLGGRWTRESMMELFIETGNR